MKILHIDSSPAGSTSTSRKYSAEVVGRLMEKHPLALVTTHDLVSKPHRLVDGAMLAGMFMPAEALSVDQKAAIARSDEAVDELLAADIVVIGAPMHNLSVPAVLKTWIDSVVRVGRTFKYTETGVVGLIPPGKKVYLVLSRGGIYSQEPFKSYDHQESYLRAILGVVGITDVVTIAAEGTNMGPEMMAAMETSVSAQIAAAME